MLPVVGFNLTLHKELWNYLADNPGATKPKGFVFLNRNGGNMSALRDCFACEAAVWARSAIGSNEGCLCDFCPLQWEEYRCMSHGSPFYKWQIDLMDFREDRDRHGYLALDLVTQARRVANAKLSGQAYLYRLV